MKNLKTFAQLNENHNDKKYVTVRGVKCVVTTGYYGNGRPAIELDNAHTGEPFMVPSVNIVDANLKPGEIAIKNYSENEGILDVLVKAGIVSKPKYMVDAGYTSVPVCDLLIKMDESHDIYFDILSATLEEVNRLAKAKGYDEINSDEFFRFGQGGISYGQTKKERFELYKNGQPTKPARNMNIQVYRMDSGKYELNAYVA